VGWTKNASFVAVPAPILNEADVADVSEAEEAINV
jgi:hypothetical protein